MLFLFKICHFCLLFQLLSANDGWWKNSKGISIQSFEHFNSLISYSNSTLKDKHLVLNFYMEGCPWCQRFQGAWNQAYDHIQSIEDANDPLSNVTFLIANGEHIRELSRKYRVSGFPTILFLRAGKKGFDAVEWEEGNREYGLFISWLTEAVEKSNKLA